MTDAIQVPNNSQHTAQKLRNALEALSRRVNDERGVDVKTALAEALAAFKKFFTELSDPTFQPQELRSGDTAQSLIYNDNLQGIYDDIQRFYTEIDALAESQASAYNFAQISNSEIIQRADALAGTVLDLNILSNFTRGDVIIAGDDFRNLESIDTEFGLGAPPAELLMGGSGLTLARSITRNIVDGSTTVTISPLAPVNPGGSGTVNIAPTPNNVHRFYEGSYYNFLGYARPEGGKFNFKYLLSTEVGEGGELTSVSIGNQTQTSEDPNGQGVYVEIGATKEEKDAVRRNMLDGDPNTFWECEYLYQVPSSLLGNVFESTAGGQENGAAEASEITIDLKAAETAAQKYDYTGRDLIVDITLSFPAAKNINIVTIDPMVFGSKSFMSVVDIATADTDGGVFRTVDGWNELIFPKTITPEANEFLTNAQVGQSLAPDKYAYKGQGIYPFPVRNTKHVKIRVFVDAPIAAPYERNYILLQNKVEADLEVVRQWKGGGITQGITNFHRVGAGLRSPGKSLGF